MFDAPLFHCHFTCSEMAPPPARSLVSGCVAIFLNTRSSFHSLAFGGKRFVENAARSPQESSLLVCQQMDRERGKNPPGDAQGSCCRGFGGKSSQRQGEERWEGNTLVFLGILGVSVLNVALWLNAHLEGTQLVQGHVLTVI